MTIPIREAADGVDEFPTVSDAACEEFQSRIPQLMGGNIYDEAHIKTCARCSALVEELEYIAEAARLYLSSQEPPDTLWKNIENRLPQAAETVESADHSSPASQ